MGDAAVADRRLVVSAPDTSPEAVAERVAEWRDRAAKVAYFDPRRDAVIVFGDVPDSAVQPALDMQEAAALIDALATERTVAAGPPDIDAAIVAAQAAWGADVTLAPAPEGGWRCFYSVVHFTVGDTPTAAILAVPAALAKSAARAAAAEEAAR